MCKWAGILLGNHKQTPFLSVLLRVSFFVFNGRRVWGGFDFPATPRCSPRSHWPSRWTAGPAPRCSRALAPPCRGHCATKQSFSVWGGAWVVLLGLFHVVSLLLVMTSSCSSVFLGCYWVEKVEVAGVWSGGWWVCMVFHVAQKSSKLLAVLGQMAEDQSPEECCFQEKQGLIRSSFIWAQGTFQKNLHQLWH